MSNHLPGSSSDDDARHDVTSRLTAGFQEMVAGGDVRVQIDAQSIALLGARKVRKRRNLTAAGVAAGVVALVVGGTIVGHPQAAGVQTAGSAAIPLCPSKSAPSSERWVASWSDSAAGSAAQSVAESRSTAVHQTDRSAGAVVSVPLGPLHVTYTVPDAGWATPAKLLQLTDAARAALPAGVNVADATAGADLSFGGFGWTSDFPLNQQALSATSDPGALASANAVATITADQVASVSATAEVTSPSGRGTLSISVGQAKPGIPPCSDGPTDRRVTEPDGAVVDVQSAPDYWMAWAGTAPPPQQTAGTDRDGLSVLQVKAYRPDGTTVIATLTRTQTGPRLPMTIDQLVSLAAAPGLDVATAPSAGQSSRAVVLQSSSLDSSTEATSPTSPSR